MKITSLNGGVMYTGGVIRTELFDGRVYEEEADCSKVVDILNKYGKDTIRTIEYTCDNKTEVLFSRKKIGD